MQSHQAPSGTASPQTCPLARALLFGSAISMRLLPPGTDVPISHLSPDLADSQHLVHVLAVGCVVLCLVVVAVVNTISGVLAPHAVAGTGSCAPADENTPNVRGNGFSTNTSCPGEGWHLA